MARVYADVNEHMPRSYWDYDSVNISWGVLENYEVVRKIGMETFSALLFFVFLTLFFFFFFFSMHEWSMLMVSIDRPRKILGSVRGHQCGQLPEVCHQGPEASQEEED